MFVLFSCDGSVALPSLDLNQDDRAQNAAGCRLPHSGLSVVLLPDLGSNQGDRIQSAAGCRYLIRDRDRDRDVGFTPLLSRGP